MLVCLSALDKATTYKAVYNLVRRLGLRWKRGIKRLNRVDPQARLEFSVLVRRLADEASRGERTLIYIDEAHIHCDLDEGYGWAWGGEPYEIPSSSPGLSKKVSLYGAFVFNDPQVVLWKADRCNTMLTLAYLFHLARVVADKPKPTIVWDGAPWHKPRYMRAIAERVLGFELVMLPAYSPDFMPVEALWRWLREEVTRNQCHDTVDALVADVVEFGGRINSDPLALIDRLWPKLELRENELPEHTEALPAEVNEQADTGGWVPPLPPVLEGLLPPEAAQSAQLVALSDKQWEHVRSLLPERANRRGNPRDRRTVVEGILWKQRNGAPWRQLPACYGARSTVHEAFTKWDADGTWERILDALAAAPQAPPLTQVA